MLIISERRHLRRLYRQKKVTSAIFKVAPFVKLKQAPTCRRNAVQRKMSSGSTLQITYSRSRCRYTAPSRQMGYTFPTLSGRQRPFFLFFYPSFSFKQTFKLRKGHDVMDTKKTCFVEGDMS
ncbi:unnamed protein product [Ixodes persulcatus]